MTTMNRPSERRRMTATVVVGGLLAVGLSSVAAPADPALAHDFVISTTPEAGDTVTEVPESFVVTASDAMLDLGGSALGFAIQVSDESGLYYGDGCIGIDGPSMSTSAALGEAGTYTMVFQYVSSDGHTVSDSLSFQYQPAGAAQSSPGSSEPPSCGGSEVVATDTEESTEDSADASAGEATQAAATEPTASASTDESGAVLSPAALLGGGIALVGAITVAAVLLLRRRQS